MTAIAHDQFDDVFGARRGEGGRMRPFTYDLAADGGLAALLEELRGRTGTPASRTAARQAIAAHVTGLYVKHNRYKNAGKLALTPKDGPTPELEASLREAADRHTSTVLRIRGSLEGGTPERDYHNILDVAAVTSYVKLMKTASRTEAPYSDLLDSDLATMLHAHDAEPRELMTAENLHGFLDLSLNLARREVRANLTNQVRRALQA